MRAIVPPLVLAAALALGALAAPPPALADEPGAEAVRRALALRDGGDLAGAIATLEAARGAAETPPLVLEALGALYLQADRPADALAALAPRVAVADPDPVVLFNAARAALALGRAEEGERYLQAAVARAPVSRAALLLWEVLDGQKRDREAAAVLAPLAAEPVAGEIEAHDPDLAADVALEYARSLIASGDQAAAIAPLQRRTRLRPDEEESWRMLGDALVDAGRLDEAQAALVHAQQLGEKQRQKELEKRQSEHTAGGG